MSSTDTVELLELQNNLLSIELVLCSAEVNIAIVSQNMSFINLYEINYFLEMQNLLELLQELLQQCCMKV